MRLTLAGACQVLNGMPFLRHHVERFAALRYEWTWDIVEGVAAGRADSERLRMPVIEANAI